MAFAFYLVWILLFRFLLIRPAEGRIISETALVKYLTNVSNDKNLTIIPVMDGTLVSFSSDAGKFCLALLITFS